VRHRLRRFLEGPGNQPESEKDAKLAQKLGQRQPFLALSHRDARANSHLLGRPDAVVARKPNPAQTVALNGPADAEQVCHYITQPLVELYGGCMVVLNVS
jgi:hypothetical protein